MRTLFGNKVEEYNPSNWWALRVIMVLCFYGWYVMLEEYSTLRLRSIFWKGSKKFDEVFHQNIKNLHFCRLNWFAKGIDTINQKDIQSSFKPRSCFNHGGLFRWFLRITILTFSGRIWNFWALRVTALCSYLRTFLFDFLNVLQSIIF